MPPTTKQNIFAQQKLESVNDQRFTWRERVTAAQINAGYTILPVVPGYKYRISGMVHDCGGRCGNDSNRRSCPRDPCGRSRSLFSSRQSLLSCSRPTTLRVSQTTRSLRTARRSPNSTSTRPSPSARLVATSPVLPRSISSSTTLWSRRNLNPASHGLR
jgi:hypothetical protein